MLLLDGSKTSCCYQCCTHSGGHNTCTVVMGHYYRLCAAAQAVLDDPSSVGNRQALQEVLAEETGEQR